MKTFMANPDTIERKWYVVDADGATLGRLASQVAAVLRGKNKPIFTPHEDCGDYVIVVNADKIHVTGKKMDQKLYRTHSLYVGGMKETTLRNMMNNKPEKVIERCTPSCMSMRDRTTSTRHRSPKSLKLRPEYQKRSE